MENEMRQEAMRLFKQMWSWLYSHPSHNKEYYVKHVVKVNPAWKNDCPLCNIAEDECSECLLLWDNGEGSLCTDPKSPLSMWKKTHLNDPNYRTWYAGQIVDLTSKVLD